MLKVDRKFNYRVPRLTADIYKTIIGRGLEIVLMERAVNLCSVDRGGSDELSFNSVLHKNYNS